MEKSLTAFLSILFCIFLSCSDSTEPENIIDETPPSVVITSPAANVTLNSAVLIKADATDNVGVDSVSFLIDGVKIGTDDSAPFEHEWQVGYWADGYIHTVFAKAYDRAGNVGQSEVISVTISKEAWFSPILISPLDGSIFRTENNVTLLWHSMLNAINYAILIADDPTFLVIYSNTTADTTFTKSNLKKGSHYWRVRAENTLGFWSDNSDSRLFIIDGPIAPVLIAPANLSVLPSSSEITLVWRKSEYAINYNVRLSVVPDFSEPIFNEIFSDTQTVLPQLQEGWYYWKTRAENSVGIWGDWSTVFKFHNGTQLDSTLICYFPFTGNTYDQSIYENHGVAYGAQLTEDRFGNPNSAYLFDGIDDYIEVPNYNNIFSIIGPFTLSAWVKPLNDGVNKIQPILWKLGNAGTTEDNYGLLYGLEFTNPANKFKVQTEATDGQDFEAHSFEHLSNSWYHIVGVNDEVNLKIYVNGVEEGSIPIGTITPFTGPEQLRIGNFLHRGTVIAPGVFEGIIDEVQIYSEALSFEEIQYIYNQMK